MMRTSMLLAASVTFTIASAAAAADTRSPTTYDEIRAYAQRRAVASAPATACARMPTTTDEARAGAGAQVAASAVAASPATTPDRARHTPTSTDEARALVAARTNARLVASSARHEQVCASCACKMGEQHARTTVDPCGCHKGT